MIERNERQPYHAQGRDEQPWIPHLRKNSRHIQSAQGHGQEQYSPQRISAECYQIHKERYTAESNEYRRQQLDTSTKRQLSPVALSLWRRDEHIIGQQMFEENPTQESQIHNELSQSDSGEVSQHHLTSTSGRIMLVRGISSPASLSAYPIANESGSHGTGMMSSLASHSITA